MTALARQSERQETWRGRWCYFSLATIRRTARAPCDLLWPRYI